LQIGVRYLPGTPEAVDIRATSINAAVSDKYVPAFLLPAVAALKIPASLIIPRGWFHPGRVVEIKHQNAEKLNAKLTLSIEHGLDYERVGFTLV
jgi:hypothetical protein